MSRAGYTEDCDNIYFINYRGAVTSALRGRRGQDFLKEMLAAMDAMPIKRLVKDCLEGPDMVSCSHWGVYPTSSVCAIGTVGRARGVDLGSIDPEDYVTVAGKFGVAEAMAREIEYVNDEMGCYRETPEQRFDRVRRWVVSNIKAKS